MTASEQITIIARTCAYVFRVPETSLVMPERGSVEVAKARHVAMYLCCVATDLERAVIGRAFGRRTVQTVDRAFFKVRDWSRTCPELMKKLNAVQEHLNIAIV